jgi:hypothetical protein
MRGYLNLREEVKRWMVKITERISVKFYIDYSEMRIV